MSINDINNDPNMLSNYILQLELLECDGEPNNALQHAVDIITQNMDNNNAENTIICPIILGCPWSSMSIRSATVLNAYHYAQITSGAASSSLMDTELDPYFYRNISNTILRAKALLQLARKLGWTRIGVVYHNGM